MLRFSPCFPRRRNMSLPLHPWQLFLMILAGWVNQQQEPIIEFQRTEIDVLKETLGKRRIRLNGGRRRRLLLPQGGMTAEPFIHGHLSALSRSRDAPNKTSTALCTDPKPSILPPPSAKLIE
jgi:hypothetical protein